MPKPQHSLIIPVEIFNREFDAKVLLSCFATERGFSVILGAKREINLNLASFPQSIYLPINLHNRNHITAQLLARLGHTLVGSDEEAIVYCSPEVYVKEKLGTVVFPQPKLFLAWGPENSRIWKMQQNYNGMPIHVTGNPRLDLLRTEMRPYWSGQIDAIQKKFGNIILINTNFGKLNHFRPNKGDEKKALEQATVSPTEVNEYDLGMAQHRLALFQHFQELVSQMANAFPAHTVLIRPHPSENHETWRQAAKGHANVQVHIEGHVIPWLLAADAIIHNSCTTGLEGYLLDRPVFSYQPIISERFDKQLPNAVSRQATSSGELIELVNTALSSGHAARTNSSETKTRLIEQYLASLQGPFASENIVNSLETFDGAFIPSSPNWATVFAAKSYALGRKLHRRFNAQFRMRDQNRSQRYDYLNHIFPEITLTHIEERIERFQQVLSRFQHIRVRTLRNNIFEIFPN
ncbi:MAG: surface carbohydrate biosynthesis protein [Nitrospirales bacterium]